MPKSSPTPAEDRGNPPVAQPVTELSELSASFQNYLKAMWTLGEWSDEPISPSALAARVGVKLPTASDAVRKLGRLGLVDYESYGAVSLTEAGRVLAVEMVRRHRLIETFLVETLGYRWDQVHDEAESLEHAVSGFMVDRIDDVLGCPARDPHGDPIPRPGGGEGRKLSGVVVLTEIAPGGSAIVERISDADPGLLRFFADHGIGVGAELHVRPGPPYSDSVDVLVGDGDGPAFPLGRTATDAIWVSPRA